MAKSNKFDVQSGWCAESIRDGIRFVVLAEDAERASAEAIRVAGNHHPDLQLKYVNVYTAPKQRG